MELLFDSKLNKILKKYEIDVIDTTELNNNFEGIIIEALTKQCKGKKCALWGAGQNNTKSSHAAVLITKYATFIQNMVCIIDSNPELHGKEFLGYPIISPAELKKNKIELVIIASKNSGESIKKNLYKMDDKCSYLDIYEELNKRGIKVYNNFYDENSIYTLIYKEQIKFNESRSEEALMNLINNYYSIRDFYFAFYYTDYYIKNFEDKKNKYSELRDEVVKILHQMANIVSQRDNDVTLFYIDALRAKEVVSDIGIEKGYFSKYIDHGITFRNIYSTAVTTYESMMSVITGKFPLEDEVYTNDFLHNKEEFRLLSSYEKKGYAINLLISDCYKVIQDSPNIQYFHHNYMTLKLWTLACILSENRKETFNFVYFPYEIHFPLLCGYHTVEPVIRAFSDLGIEDFPQTMERQYIDCLEYTDKQFEFYYDLIGKDTKKVFFSDHSQVVYDPNNNGKTYNMYYKDKELTTHVPLIISKNAWEPVIEDNYFSMVDFNTIVLDALENKQYKTCSKDIIRYQYYPMHNPKMREHAKKNHYEDYIDGMDLFSSEDYICLITATGKCEVYKNSDLTENIYFKDEGKEFLNLVKNTYNPAYQVSMDGEENE